MCSQATKDAEIETMRSTNLLDVSLCMTSIREKNERDDGNEEGIC